MLTYFALSGLRLSSPNGAKYVTDGQRPSNQVDILLTMGTVINRLKNNTMPIEFGYLFKEDREFSFLDYQHCKETCTISINIYRDTIKFSGGLIKTIGGGSGKVRSGFLIVTDDKASLKSIRNWIESIVDKTIYTRFFYYRGLTIDYEKLLQTDTFYEAFGKKITVENLVKYID